jgi:2-polyprenyl-3-methyl-5-hydroxy-6-metoxy-1,4-benzoquinol methylase
MVMGTSALGQWDRILWAIEGSPHPHQRVLDVGAGHGKAGILMREYLNMKPVLIDALEPNRDAFVHRLKGSVYDDVLPILAADFPDFHSYDTVLIADVIEHMSFQAGMKLVESIPGQVIISTPVFPLDAKNDGLPELEHHVCEWTLKDFNRTGRLNRHWIWTPPRAPRLGQHIVRLRPRG